MEGKEFWGSDKYSAIHLYAIYLKICCLSATSATAERRTTLNVIMMSVVSGSRRYTSIMTESLAILHVAAWQTRKQENIKP